MARHWNWNYDWEDGTLIYIFDIDGTIANLAHRLHFIQQEEKDWTSFYAVCGKDNPFEDVLYFARLLFDVGHIIVLISGRSDECREQTEKWLRTNYAPYKVLLMRKQGDHRPDNVVKGELLDELCADLERSSIAGIFEDRDQVVKMYREKGFRVFQVADGNF